MTTDGVVGTTRGSERVKHQLELLCYFLGNNQEGDAMYD